MSSKDELEEFASIVSHDLQEPLRMVTMYLDLLGARHKAGIDPQAWEYVEKARRGALNCQKLLQELLVYSRATSHPLNIQPVNLNDVVKAVVEDKELNLVKSGGVVTVDKLPMVQADEELMLKLFLELVSNAVDYRSPSRILEVRITAEETKDAWSVSVADNGTGIEPKYQERVFAVFQRLEAKNEMHSGMGLALARRIAVRHGGTLTVVSDKDKGAVFRFSIPKKRVE